jgi:tetratricopeptide (TPR) repeat protein
MTSIVRALATLGILGVPVTLAWGESVPLRVLLKENRLQEAATACRQLEAAGSANGDAWFDCGRTFFRTQRPSSAEALMAKLRAAGRETETKILEAYDKASKKRYPEAKEILTGLVGATRGTSLGIAVLEAQGEIYEAQGQADTAAFLHRQLYGEENDNGWANWGLGRYYLTKGELARAKEHLERAARAWPRHLGSRYNLAQVALQENNLADAAKWLAECYKIDRADVGVLEQMGLLFEKKGMIGEAVKYWARAVERDKNATVARAKLAEHASTAIDALIERGDYEGAAKKLETVPTKMLVAEPRLLLKRGVVRRFLGQYDKATKDLLVYLKKSPDDALAHRELGVCYLNRGQLAPAQKSFARAIELAPAEGRSYAWYGFLMEAKGDLENARSAWKRAVELITEPEELEKANRRLQAVEAKWKKRDEREREKAKERAREEADDPEGALQKEDLFRQVPGFRNRPRSE